MNPPAADPRASAQTEQRPGARRRAVLAFGAASAWGATGLLALAGCSREQPAAQAKTPAAPADPRQAFEKAQRGTGFTVGAAASQRLALVFFDPQCGHCAALWLASKPLLDRVRMVWMPVAFVSEKSAPQGAMLLAAPDAAALMDQHESRLAARLGGLELTGPAAPERLAQIKANTDLLMSLGADSVPHLLVRSGEQGPWGVHAGGLPSAELAHLLGL